MGPTIVPNIGYTDPCPINLLEILTVQASLDFWLGVIAVLSEV